MTGIIQRGLSLASFLPIPAGTPLRNLCRYLLALVLVAIAIATRDLIGPPQLGLPFLTFFPAATFGAILAGIGPGLVAAVLGAALATYFYIPPFGALPLDFHAGTVWSNVIFLLDEFIVCVAIQAMHESIAAQRKTVVELKESSDLLNAVINGTSDAVFAKDREGRYRLFNAAAENYTGKRAGEVIGHDDMFLFEAEEARTLMANDLAVMTKGEIMVYEDKLTTRDGTQRIFQAKIGPLHAPDGTVSGVFGIARDISTIRQAEEAIIARSSLQDQLAKVTESVPGVICSFKLNPDGSMSMPYASPAFESIFGIRPEEVREDFSPALALMHPEDVDAVVSSVHASAHTMEAWRAEFRVRHPQKGEVWVGGHSMPMQEADGSILWHGYIQDITERKHAEEQMRLAARVFDRAAEGVLVTDDHARILTVNQSFTTVTGYSRAEVIGKTPAILQSGRQGPDFYASMWEAVRIKGWWQGEIWNRRKNGEIYLEWLSINSVKDGAGKVVNFVGLFSDITLAKESQQRMAFLATHDELTGLPNRALFNDQLHMALARADRSGSPLAVLFVDLDNFKVINDTLGHDLGDALLVQAAHRLRDCVRAEDMVARLGGDEFVVLLDASRKDDAAVTAERIASSLSAAVMLHGQECFTSASIGISLFPEDGCDSNTLMRNADTAMYRAKARGKNTFQFFSKDMAEQAYHRLNIENGLRRAIKGDELFIEYQPQVDLLGKVLTGAEALVRWRRNGNTVPPIEFIPIAEESGLIIEIGEWVVREVCRQLAEWDRKLFSVSKVSVNISARHFRQADMVSRIKSIVTSAGIAPSRVCLEITESALADVDIAMSMLSELEAFGFEVSVDDFGTGFSSLSYLKRFHIHELKIDRSFVDGIATDPDDRAITMAIIAMARSLGLRVVAEGIETTSQQAELQAFGCHMGQGYLYARPLPPAAFERWTLEQRETERQ